MKHRDIILLSGFMGLLIGYCWPRVSNPEPPEESSPKRSERRFSRSGPDDRRTLAEITGSLSPAEWPEFFERHRNRDPEMLAQLWSESDPQGFWTWLREGKDRLDLEELGPILLDQWMVEDPEAAMAATMEITDKRLADQLRRRVVDATLERDLQKGLEFAAMAGDFNRFSHGDREWMKHDPEAAVRGLAGLPNGDDYRGLLRMAIPHWLKADPAAALAWLADPPDIQNEGWLGNWIVEGYRSAATVDPEGAWKAAQSISDPQKRKMALSGLLSSGQFSVEQSATILAELPLPLQSRIANDLNETVRREGGSFADAAEVLAMLPANKNSLHAVESHARDWAAEDPDAAWRWATSLDQASQRAAVESMVKSVPVTELDRIAELPWNALSNDLFKAALDRFPSDADRHAWLNGLPAEMRAWAEEARNGR